MLKIEIIGNLGGDAKVKNLNGRDCVSFNVAHSETRNGVESTVWASVLLNGNGGNLLQYLKSGTKVFVRGSLSVNQYQDKNGRWCIGLNVSASEVQLCGGKSEPAAPAPAPSPADPYPAPF